MEDSMKLPKHADFAELAKRIPKRPTCAACKNDYEPDAVSVEHFCGECDAATFICAACADIPARSVDPLIDALLTSNGLSIAIAHHNAKNPTCVLGPPPHRREA